MVIYVFSKSSLNKKACAATGQNGLMALYSSLFSNYGIETAQVLVTKADFRSEHTLQNLASTLNYLLDANIVPILNTNDAISYPPEVTRDIDGSLNINDNDSLSAKLATLIRSDLLLLMSDVDGVYDRHPSETDASLISSFVPKLHRTAISFGEKSNVGTGGMESKISAASYAVDNDCSVIICNGKLQNAIVDSVCGKKVGTFFTNDFDISSNNIENMAINGKHNSSNLYKKNVLISRVK